MTHQELEAYKTRLESMWAAYQGLSHNFVTKASMQKRDQIKHELEKVTRLLSK